MGKPKVLLLENFEKDSPIVFKLLERLESTKAISVQNEDKNALSFFSLQEPSPKVIIMYLDTSNSSGIYFMENSYLLKMKKYGLKSNEQYIIKQACETEIDLVQFLASVLTKTNTNQFLEN